LGFVLNGDRIVCVDLDHCLERGKLAPWAAQILAAMPKTYVEVSPGRDGLHIWGLGDVGRGRRIPVAGGGSLEIYGRDRYITVTGKRFGPCPRRLAELPDAITQLAAE
jgi:primase-polymerase (primpol)-like protein